MGRLLSFAVIAAVAASFLSWAPAHKKPHAAAPHLAAHAGHAQFYCANPNAIALLRLVRSADDGIERSYELATRLLVYPQPGGCELGLVSGGVIRSVPVPASGMRVAVCRVRDPEDARKWVYYLPFSLLSEKTLC